MRRQIRRSAVGRWGRGGVRLALCVSLLAQSLLLPAAAGAQVRTVKPQQGAPAGQSAGGRLASTRLKSLTARRVNFKTLAGQAARAPRRSQPTRLQAARPPLSIRERRPAGRAPAPQLSFSAADAAGPQGPSPSPAQNYLAQEDAPKAGTGTFTIPPDTMGAVGLDKVFVNLNNNYRVQNKTTGAALSTVSIDSFWAATGATDVFDPRVIYDPYNQRWILAAVSDPSQADSSVLLGLSETSDPQGNYSLFRAVVGCAGGTAECHPEGEWADFPMLGFNKNWVAISWNQFGINFNSPLSGNALIFDYPALRGGTADATHFVADSSLDGFFCMHPATTLSPSEPKLYFVSHIDSATASYRVFTTTGTPAAPSLAAGDIKVRDAHGQGGWTQPAGDRLPQQCVAGATLPTQLCPAPGNERPIHAGDAFLRSIVVFRGGKLYYSQTVELPAGGETDDSRFAAQWTVLNAATGDDVDGGRVEDASATRTNGGRHYAYSSIAVNRYGDFLLGFSEFESDDYADAAYALRLAGDPPATTRDPVVYKEGEDYYEKDFGGFFNRWGDYSHTVIDPSNDADFWTIQEYAGARVGVTGQGQNDSRWGTWWAKVAAPAGEGGLIISEFRLRGPGGAADEFVEIYNNTDAPHRVAPADGSAGYALVASDGTARFHIPAGTTIPARGHFLGTNSAGYSLNAYPAGVGAGAQGDATYTADIPDNRGIALFNTADPNGFTSGNRLDAAGPTTEANALYKEGTGYPPLTAGTLQHSLYRSLCPSNAPTFGTSLGCVPGGSGRPKDTDANQSDFVFADVTGANAGAGRRLGAPGPENLSSPVERNQGFSAPLLDSSKGASSSPNRTRDLTADPANNSSFGTLEIRRRYVNNTGAPVTRLRFRIADITTYPAPSTFADLRARTSATIVVSGVNDTATCSPQPKPCSVTVRGTTVETPPAQPGGGGFNSSLSVELPAPLAPNASVNVRFLLGIEQNGNFRFYLGVEALN